MATLTLGTTSKSGLTFTTAAASAGGDVVDNTNGDTLLYVANGGGGSITVTITAQETAPVTSLGTLTIADEVITVGAGATKIIGPFNTTLYNNSSNQLAIAYSGVSSVTVAAFKTGRQ